MDFHASGASVGVGGSGLALTCTVVGVMLASSGEDVSVSCGKVGQACVSEAVAGMVGSLPHSGFSHALKITNRSAGTKSHFLIGKPVG